MERRIELLAGLGASALGLIGVVMESRALADPVTNPTLSWILGQRLVPGMGNAVTSTQDALLPVAAILVTLGLGAYLHAVHGRTAGLLLLGSCSAAVIVAIGLMVFNTTYVQLLFVPAPLVVAVAFLAAAASVNAFSVAGLFSLAGPAMLRHQRRRSAGPTQVR